MDAPDNKLKSGMVAIIGLPNAGKSTLMNKILGQKISIVTPKAQTTRNRIAGIANGSGYQIVFLDTPGLHVSQARLNVGMMKQAMDSIVDVDCVLFLHDVTAQSPQRLAPEKLSELESVLRSIKSPAILVLNKVDLVDRKEILPLIDAYSKLFPFAAIVPLSALKGEGVDRLMDEVLIRLPEGPQYFPDDIPTDATERFLCAEIIREKVFFQTGQEIPYSTAVQVESFKEDEDKPLVTIHATIFLERPSQKGIVIGKGGEKLKSIGTAARKDIEQLLGIKVMLKLWVKIHKNWTQDERFLRELGL